MDVIAFVQLFLKDTDKDTGTVNGYWHQQTERVFDNLYHLIGYGVGPVLSWNGKSA